MSAATHAPGLTRANLSQRRLVCLDRGGRFSPDVWLVEAERGPVVVKDFAERGAFVRAVLGPWFVSHESRIHRQLGPHPAVPRWLGRIDRLAFAIEHRGGVRISRRQPWTFSPEFGRRLDACVREMHALGVVHLDLRHRSNVRAGLDGEPVLIDFASAVGFRPGSFAARHLLPLLGIADRAAVAKWRRRIARYSAGAAGAASATGAASEGPRGANRPT